MSRWWMVLAAVLVVGCTKPAPKVGTVTGMVTLDEKGPLPTGEITFELEKSGKVPTSLPITNGKFEGKVPVGKHKVALYSYKKSVVPKGQPGEGDETTTNILPDRYSSASADFREVTEAGPNHFEIKVTSK